MIKFESINKEYVQGANKVCVLKDFNFELSESGIIAIVGKSGSGKSTFLSLLGGLDSVSSGTITIGDDTISNMSESELTKFRAKNIGIIFQNFQLIEHFTTMENVLLPLEILKIKDPQEKALAVLKMVGLDHRLDHFPGQLSGGEKQRAAIARAYVGNPALILADEPSGNLDPDTAAQVMDLLFSTARQKGQTVLLVTHDIELAKKCDHIYEIKNHQIKKIAP